MPSSSSSGYRPFESGLYGQDSSGGSGGGSGYGDGVAALFEDAQHRRSMAQQELDYKKSALDRQYAASSKSAAAQARYQQQSLALQKQKMELDAELGRGQLGLSYLQGAAQMRGPDNWYQYANFVRGAQANAPAPWIQQLYGTLNLPGFGQQGPNPTGGQSYDKIAGQLTGSGGFGGSGGDGSDPGLAQIKELGMRGPHTWAPGSLESMNPTELGLLKSGLEASVPGMPAFDWDTVMKQYSSAKLGTDSPLLAA